MMRSTANVLGCWSVIAFCVARAAAQDPSSVSYTWPGYALSPKSRTAVFDVNHDGTSTLYAADLGKRQITKVLELRQEALPAVLLGTAGSVLFSKNKGIGYKTMLVEICRRAATRVTGGILTSDVPEEVDESSRRAIIRRSSWQGGNATFISYWVVDFAVPAVREKRLGNEASFANHGKELIYADEHGNIANYCFDTDKSRVLFPGSRPVAATDGRFVVYRNSAGIALRDIGSMEDHILGEGYLYAAISDGRNASVVVTEFGGKQRLKVYRSQSRDWRVVDLPAGLVRVAPKPDFEDGFIVRLDAHNPASSGLWFVSRDGKSARHMVSSEGSK